MHDTMLQHAVMRNIGTASCNSQVRHPEAYHLQQCQQGTQTACTMRCGEHACMESCVNTNIQDTKVMATWRYGPEVLN